MALSVTRGSCPSRICDVPPERIFFGTDTHADPILIG
jgi:hypothetical protein